MEFAEGEEIQEEKNIDIHIFNGILCAAAAETMGTGICLFASISQHRQPFKEKISGH